MDFTSKPDSNSRFEMIYFGKFHSESDIIIYVPEIRILMVKYYQLLTLDNLITTFRISIQDKPIDKCSVNDADHKINKPCNESAH